MSLYIKENGNAVVLSGFIVFFLFICIVLLYAFHYIAEGSGIGILRSNVGSIARTPKT